MATITAKDIGLTNWRPCSFPIHTQSPLAIWIGQWRAVLARRNQFYDESNERMDEWMGGRRDVALGSDRRSSGGSAGRCDWQAVKEMIMGYAKYENQNSHTGIAQQDGCLLARRQLSVGRPDLPLRQSAAEASAETFGREAVGGRALGHDAGTEFYLCASEPGHQKV